MRSDAASSITTIRQFARLIAKRRAIITESHPGFWPLSKARRFRCGGRRTHENVESPDFAWLRRGSPEPWRRRHPAPADIPTRPRRDDGAAAARPDGAESVRARCRRVADSFGLR